ncbi:hypothetical protein M758_2G204300 [Ceratodon purpureus]|nr:hypothetical protein M758_2G204300 [Ceratodon purpureus]
MLTLTVFLTKFMSFTVICLSMTSWHCSKLNKYLPEVVCKIFLVKELYCSILTTPH